MKIIIEQFWQDLGEVEKRVQEHTTEVLKHLRENGKRHSLDGVTMQQEGISVMINDISEDFGLDVVEVGEDEISGAHIYSASAFDVYELLLLLRYIRDNIEQ